MKHSTTDNTDGDRNRTEESGPTHSYWNPFKPLLLDALPPTPDVRVYVI